MTTILIATQYEEIQSLLPWAAHLAASRNSELTLLLTQRKKGETRLVDLHSTAVADDSDLIVQARSSIQQLFSGSSVKTNPPLSDPVRLLQIVGERWSSDLATKLAELNPVLVIIPAPTISKDQSAADDWQTALLTQVPCDVILLRDDGVCIDQHVRAAVFITDGADNEAALRYASKLITCVGGVATAVYVEPNVGDDAASVGRRQLENLLHQVFRPRDREAFQQQVIVAGSISEAFRELNAGSYDILLMGTRDLREMRRFLQASPVTVTEAAPSIPAVAVVKHGESLSGRFLSRVDRAIRNVVPQLSRDERVELVSRIQDSSKWNFDFVFLISLATLIACFGLAENSGAVIVGAMLVAPLMTPIAGVGLGVAHANSYLTKAAFRTALRGFATAICIGLLFGFSVQGCARLGWLSPLCSSGESDFSEVNDTVTDDLTFPQEMENRTRPQFYDLLIAFTSGIAAAYAMGRPNLFSALPGVAIAAALVPPIATSGIALSHGDLTKGGGALLLFLTNMVTIILGASLIFRTVGVRSQKEGPNAARWPRYVLLLLVLMTIVIEFKNRN